MFNCIKLCLAMFLVLSIAGCAKVSKTQQENISEGYKVWHTATFDFQGPEISEQSAVNPFLDYRLDVIFTHEGGGSYEVPGFYAADGNAAQTGADSGNIWQVRFTPNISGEWRYSAVLFQGANIALSEESHETEAKIATFEGRFKVSNSDKISPDFRAEGRGRLISANGYFTFEKSGTIWLKGGTNSPENFLAYEGFDQTFRLKKQARAGEAAASDKTLHQYAVHESDFEAGDLSWHGDNSKGIIGAVNYLAAQGMNSIYLLSLNLEGDGQDVWPYSAPDQFDRFDVSKLEQWNLLFEHMQHQGILVHFVLQETENELLLDGGEMGSLRQLYFKEMIARFGHLPGLVWNLGEENGPIHWRPEGQTDQQRRNMASFIKDNDPYNHPVIIHTHAGAKDKDELYENMIGFNPLDGLSLQIAERRTVLRETRKWRQKSVKANHPWLLTMDEIGPWHTGAVPDVMSGGHDSLRRHVLWGHFMAGGAGVEWYFGAHYPHNDLGVEDFSTREELWRQTRHALGFFESYVPIDRLEACPDDFIDRRDVYCAAIADDFFLLYLPESSNGMFNLPRKAYSVLWFDPVQGGVIQHSNKREIIGRNWMNLGLAPKEDGRDWVLMLRAK